MEIKSVALLGAGAVGSYIIWGLSKLPDIRFGIIAEGNSCCEERVKFIILWKQLLCGQLGGKLFISLIQATILSGFSFVFHYN